MIATQRKGVSVSEAVNHPAHYGGDTTYEVIKVLEVWLSPEEFRGFCKGNVHKYLARAKLKGGVEDQKKAAWYANRLVDFNKRHPETPTLETILGSKD
jgi:hypothetical protein